MGPKLLWLHAWLVPSCMNPHNLFQIYSCDQFCSPNPGALGLGLPQSDCSAVPNII